MAEGCVTCRIHRVGCDRTRPRCARCDSSGHECLWPDSQHGGIAHERVRKACLPCRRRKIRCAGPSDPDDEESTCARCERLSLVCSWADHRSRRRRSMQVPRSTAGSDPGDRAGVHRGSVELHRGSVELHRGSVEAHQGSVELHHGSIELHHGSIELHQGSVEAYQGSVEAQTTNLPTRSTSATDPQDNTPASQTIVPIPSITSHDILNEKAELQQILRTYFGTVHYFGFLSYIHEPTLFRLIERNKHPRNLTAVMVACTLRLAGNHSPEAFARADLLFQGALHTIQKQVYEAYGAIELMTVVLLRQYEQMKGNYSSAWMLWGNAVKMMQFLSLHNYDEVYPQPHSIVLNRLLSPEALRRLAWSVYFLDCMGDAGRHGVHTVTEEGYQIQLPCDETSFVRGIEVRTESLNRPGNVPCLSPTGQPPPPGVGLGVSGHIIKTSAFRRRILHYKSRLKYMTATAQSMLEHLASVEHELKILMAELPPDLVYVEDNLYIHPERRTAFFLLHALRHNCFIMLAETRLLVCSRDPNLHDLAYTWMRDRVRHAYPVSRIVADALRLGVVCDPFVGCLAYTGIEVLLFDSERLAHVDPSIDPKSPGIIKAIKRLLEMIRVLGAVDNGLGHMRIEACRRIIRRGLGEEILTQADWEACQTDRHASGEDDSEFDFRVFRWHRLEHTGRIPHAARNPWAAEAILDLEANPISRDNSRRPSPRPDQLDACAVSSLGTQAIRTGSVEFMSPLEAFDVAFPNAHSSSNGHPMDALPQEAGPWMVGPRIGPDGTRSFEDDFERFMEQAGYATGSGADPLPWLQGQN